MKREEISMIISYLKKGKMLDHDLEDLLNSQEDKDSIGMEYELNEVNNIDELRALTDYEYCGSYETEETVTIKGLNIAFHKKLPDGRYIYRDLVVCANGFKFLSDEHF